MTFISDKYDRGQLVDIMDHGLVSQVTRELVSTQPALSLEYMKNKVLRVGHSLDDSRILTAIDTGRAMIEAAYGITLHDQAITFTATGPARTLYLPQAGFDKLTGVTEYTKGVATVGTVSDYYFIDGMPSVLHHVGGMVVPVGVDYVSFTYDALSARYLVAVEAWALTAAQVYEYKTPYAIGVQVGNLPDMARMALEALGYVPVGSF